MNLDPMLAMFGIGGIFLPLAVVFIVFFCVIVVPVAGVVAIVYIIANRNKPMQQSTPLAPVPPAPAAPLAAGQPQPVFSKTVVMGRKCPQCGAELKPDAPEGLCPACLLQRGFATEAGASSAPSSFVPPPIDELAKLFPQLEIQECLGRGGMGAVYKARQPRLDRLVALKILAPEKQNDPQFAERFEREARVLAKLSHPNIVSVFEFGEVQGRFYLIMEYVDGLTLRQVMQAGRISPAQALELVPKICEALQYAHEQGIVHRDIKPENILIDKQGRVKIADFGIAKIAGVEAKGLSLTGARDVMGTPNYMAPEQVEKPQTVDHRADIYSLGVVFFEMLTGELPLGKFQPPSTKVQMDVRLDEVVLHALEKEPSRRYQHASQVKTAVETIAGSPPQIGAVPTAAAVTLTDASDKIILPAFLLAFFFGPFGAHRFYVGKIGTGFAQLFTCGGLGIWATIDWILLCCKVFTDADGRRLTNWIHPGPSLPRPAAQTSQAGNFGASIAAKPDRFWRNFAIVVVCVLLIPIIIIIVAVLVSIVVGASRPTAAAGFPRQFQGAALRQESGEYRTNFTQSFPLNADGRFSIDNINGQVQIHGWSSNIVALTVAIHGKTPESVEAMRIEVNTDPNHADVHTETSNGNGGFQSLWDLIKHGLRDNATVDYTVHVPEGVRLDGVSSVNGQIDIAGVAGDIAASTVNGETKIKGACGNLKLNTVNGSITADMNSLRGGQKVSLDAVNGELNLTLPEDADATFSVTTVNGEISSEFPSLQAKKDWPVGNNLKGSLGNGAASVKVNAVNGTVKFLKKTAAEPATNASPATSGQGEAAAVAAAQKWLAVIDAGNYSGESGRTPQRDIPLGGVTETNWDNLIITYR